MKTFMVVLAVFLFLNVTQSFAEEHKLSFMREQEKMFGLKQGLLSAVFFVESSNGRITGNYQVVSVVSEHQLHYTAVIALHTQRRITDLSGSSAGAMGPFQFLPATWWQYKQDGDGDGKRDPYNFFDSAKTAALYLTRLIAIHGESKALRKYAGIQKSSLQYARRIEKELKAEVR